MSSLKLGLAIVPVLAASAFGANPAHALLIGYQNTPAKPFSGSGNGQINFSPLPLTFPTFKPADIPADRINPVLVGYRFYIPSLTFGGTVVLGNSNPITPIPGPFQPQVTIGFQNIDTQTIPPRNPDVAFSPILANQIPGTLPPFSFTNFNLSGGASNVFTSTTALTPPTSTFTNPPTITPVSTAYFTTSWALLGPPNPTLLSGFVSASMNGTVGVQYVYQYVPGPLPILGSAAAFGWSRRLRKRIAQVG
jgi:hypothetical protein